MCLNKICYYFGKRKHLKPQFPLLKNNVKNKNYNLKCSNNVNFTCSYLNDNLISSHNMITIEMKLITLLEKINLIKFILIFMLNNLIFLIFNDIDNSYEIDNKLFNY